MCDGVYPEEAEPKFEVCLECGVRVHVGDFPFCRGGHMPVQEYRPFIPWFDIGLGQRIDSLATWNRVMKEKGWDLRSKYDREEPPPQPSSKGISQAFNESVRKHYGGVLPVGNFLDDRD